MLFESTEESQDVICRERGQRRVAKKSKDQRLSSAQIPASISDLYSRLSLMLLVTFSALDFLRHSFTLIIIFLFLPKLTQGDFYSLQAKCSYQINMLTQGATRAGGRILCLVGAIRKKSSQLGSLFTTIEFRVLTQLRSPRTSKHSNLMNISHCNHFFFLLYATFNVLTNSFFSLQYHSNLFYAFIFFLQIY